MLMSKYVYIKARNLSTLTDKLNKAAEEGYRLAAVFMDPKAMMTYEAIIERKDD